MFCLFIPTNLRAVLGIFQGTLDQRKRYGEKTYRKLLTKIQGI